MTSHRGPKSRRRDRRRDRGASLVEYLLLVVLIAMLCLAAVTLVGDRTGGSLEDSGDSLAWAAATVPDRD